MSGDRMWELKRVRREGTTADSKTEQRPHLLRLVYQKEYTIVRIKYRGQKVKSNNKIYPLSWSTAFYEVRVYKKKTKTTSPLCFSPPHIQLCFPRCLFPHEDDDDDDVNSCRCLSFGSGLSRCQKRHHGAFLLFNKLHNSMRWSSPLPPTPCSQCLLAGLLRQTRHINLTNGSYACVAVTWRLGSPSGRCR